MKTLFVLISVLFISNLANSQNSCTNAFQYCGNDVGLALDTTGADLGAINCLASSPNPTWFFFEVDQPGDINLEITGTSSGGSGVDIDVLVFGPFATLDCDSIPNGPIAHCDYSTSGINPFTIDSTQSGEIYIIVVTNFENLPGTADFVNQSSTATFVQSSCFGGFDEFSKNDFDFSVVNPFNDFLQLSDLPSNCTISVYDMAGKKVYHKEKISYNHSVKLNYVESGVLIVELINDSGEKSIRKAIKF